MNYRCRKTDNLGETAVFTSESHLNARYSRSMSLCISSKTFLPAPVSTSSKMRSIKKSTRRYSDAHSNGEMNHKMDDIDQFGDSLILKR
ncbi:hypothetical protein TNCV_2930371 [Trichonephila clavipes]|nr:hypothetical protein TNCV_2930371 [Trichonephila clavipes]